MGALRPTDRGGVVRGHDVAELRAVMGARRRQRSFPDEAMDPVNTGIVLVAGQHDCDVMLQRRGHAAFPRPGRPLAANNLKFTPASMCQE